MCMQCQRDMGVDETVEHIFLEKCYLNLSVRLLGEMNEMKGVLVWTMEFACCLG